MRRFYQTQWHGIPFESFAHLSSAQLADASFYASFYDAFFRKYSRPEDLDREWLEVKRQSADFIGGHDAVRNAHDILSIGCGLGLIEKQLLERGCIGLEITEVAEQPLRWIRPMLPPGRVHVGVFPQCLPDAREFDAILLIGVEGVFDDASLAPFLADVHSRLRPGGACLMLSWTCEHGGAALAGARVKDVVKAVLEKIGVRHRGQLWGYLRTPQELRRLVASAGFSAISDGELEKRTRFGTYWLLARRA